MFVLQKHDSYFFISSLTIQIQNIEFQWMYSILEDKTEIDANEEETNREFSD